MKIAFHLENLSFRGTTVAVQDYAHFNKTLLNNESIFFYQKDSLQLYPDENFSKREEILNTIKNDYDVIEYDTVYDLEEKLIKKECDYAYFLKAGYNDGLELKTIKSLIHCVFNVYQPHGYKYAYISKWLSNLATQGKVDKSSPFYKDLSYVPHIVDLPKESNLEFRKKYKIPADAIVFGRYGGYDQFDIDFVKELIGFIVNFDPSIYFVFVNTRPFLNHNNIVYLDPILSKQEKTNYIKACDAMIHARSDGESFGLSIAEFLFHNKSVISFGEGRDKNNVEMLRGYDGIFNNQYEFLEQVFKVKNKLKNLKYSSAIEDYLPENVMKRFDEVFLR